MTPLEIIKQCCKGNAPLRNLLMLHSQQVRDRALLVADRHPELNLNRQLLADGAMLHDIGVTRCDAPGIHCHGTAPYIEHGPLGAAILREMMEANPTLAQWLTPIARICERHTGTGLPGYEPETMEEKVVCYADKFFSKSHPERTRTAEQTAESLRKFGEAGVKIFLDWDKEFR